MKYTHTQAVSEILRRGSRFAEERRQRLFRFWTGISGLMMVLLAVTVIRFAGSVETGSEESVYGAFIVSGMAGGYVLTGVIAFVAGVTVTLACLKYKKTLLQRRERDKAGDRESDR